MASSNQSQRDSGRASCRFVGLSPVPELRADDFKVVMPDSARRLFPGGGRQVLVVCLTAMLYLATIHVAVCAQDDVNQSPAVADDDRQTDPPIFELEPESNPDLIAAMQSLDESLKDSVEPTGDQLTRNRLIAIGLIGSTLLALLGVVFGYLRMDHATRGFYCGRLQLVAGGCSIVVLAVSYFLWTQVLFP